MIEDKNLINSSITGYFSNLFSKNSSTRSSITGMKFNQLNFTVASGLETYILESECFAALKSLGQNKASGPDGFR